ncbi:MAG TPA: diguanylate cyclase [Microbacterium sp.]|uniref:diguanylate cyclase domain-containing protein n=1 Tax=Microbacterium sp. TaxID=51671 RepID=UPI002C44308E|nr:diguanylate cyclase [Microbacterium sp.]HWI32052.1 diguanylate cyclase [Microbacterium sp.]
MLDQLTLSIATAIVVLVSGVVFVLETLLRKDEGAGRVWALAFLAGMLTTLSYLIWATTPDNWWAVAVGNAAFVAGTGCLWLGCRRFNERSMRVPGGVVAAASAAAFAAVVLEGPDGGDWAGALVMFVSLAVFAAAGTGESVRGEMGRNRNAIGMAFVLGLQSLYYVGRSIVFVTVGPDSPLFRDWFGPAATSLLTITLTIVAVITTSVLRAGRVQLRGRSATTMLGLGSDGVLEPAAFARVLGDRIERSERNRELIGVISVRLDDLAQIATAFGTGEAQEVRQAWREATRRFAPTTSFIGDDGRESLAIGIHPTSPAEARRMATRVHRGLIDALSALSGSVIPVVGVGIALSDAAGYDPDTLVEAARGAASRAADSPDASVILAGSD